MTTIITVRKGGKVVMAGDGQVSLGQTVMKGNARKVRRIGKGEVIAGFAGATADAFTLLQLQRAIEALAGLTLHKQNFRRLIEQQQLVEETGDMATETGGRPAKLFRFRQTVLDERALSGTKLPLSRN